MNTILVLFILLFACILMLFISNKYLKYKNGDIIKIHENAIYNGKDTDPPLSTFNTIGCNLYGDFRMDFNGSSVKYLFFCILIPLIPIGCYRAKKGNTVYLGKQGAARVNETKYTIYGTEKWNAVEVISIYLFVTSIIIGIILICYLWDYIFFFFDCKYNV